MAKRRGRKSIPAVESNTQMPQPQDTSGDDGYWRAHQDAVRALREREQIEEDNRAAYVAQANRSFMLEFGEGCVTVRDGNGAILHRLPLGLRTWSAELAVILGARGQLNPRLTFGISEQVRFPSFLRCARSYSVLSPSNDFLPRPREKIMTSNPLVHSPPVFGAKILNFGAQEMGRRTRCERLKPAGSAASSYSPRTE